MWASAHVINEKLVRSDKYHRAIPVGATNLSSAKAYGSSKSTGADTADDTLIGDDDIEGLRGSPQQHRLQHMAMVSRPNGAGSTGSGLSNHGRDVDDDLEMQQLKGPGDGVVVVDRTYSVRSD